MSLHPFKTIGKFSENAIVATIMFVTISSVAMSQEAATDTQESGVSDSISEIVVTARKKAETLISIPESVSVLDGSALAQENIQSFLDYGNKIPNMAFSYGATQNGLSSGTEGSTGVTIRGISGTATTTMYVDDTQIDISQDPRILDINRIEVLKGPQGTLYGAGAIGGTIRYITNQPNLNQDSWSYMVQGGGTQHGTTPDFGGSAIGNVVLIPDKLALRTVFFAEHDSGFVTRTYPLYPPGSGVPGSYEAGQLGEVGGQGESIEYGVTLKALYQVTENFAANAKLLMQWNEDPEGDPAVHQGITSFDPTTLTVNREANLQTQSASNWYLPALTLNYDNNGIHLVSSTGDFIKSANRFEDITEAAQQTLQSVYGFVWNNPVGQAIDFNWREFQQELRLTTDPWHNFSSTVGLYYQNLTHDQELLPRVFPGLAGTGGADSDLYYAGNVQYNEIDRAAFATLNYDIGSLIHLSAGARDYSVSVFSWSQSAGAVVDSPGLLTNKPPRATESGVSPKYSVSLTPNATTTVYTSAAKGFRPGGGAGKLIPSSCDSDLQTLGATAAEIAAGYKSDSVWTYEFGAKKSLFSNRFYLSGAIFQTNWKDIQQTVFLPSCGVSFTGNAGAARVRGEELEASGDITKSLKFDASLGIVNAVITNDANGLTDQHVGSRLYNTPNYNASVDLNYEHKIADGKNTWFTSLDVTFVGSSVSPNGSALTPSQLGAYHIANLRTGIIRGNDKWTLYINNLTNEEADYGELSSTSTQSIVVNGVKEPYGFVVISRPRQFGLKYEHGL